MDIRRVLGSVALAFAAASHVSVAGSSEPLSVVRADRLPAPSGYVAYELHLWGVRASGRFASIQLQNGGLVFEHGLDGGGILEQTHVDRIDRSVVFLPRAFIPSPELLAKHPKRLLDVALPEQERALLVLRPLGRDPLDSSVRLYEATISGVVFSGTVSGFELHESIVRAGYPYRGPYGLRGALDTRRAAFPGEKSILRVPMNVTVPDILIERAPS